MSDHALLGLMLLAQTVLGLAALIILVVHVREAQQATTGTIRVMQEIDKLRQALGR